MRKAAGLCVQCGFNPLPLPKQGEMNVRLHVRGSTTCFNPLPLPKQGEIPCTSAPRPSATCFNPLPLPKQGEILEFAVAPINFIGFQSAPPAEARGDARGAGRSSLDVTVSIRSPCRSKGRFNMACRYINYFRQFQSAPPAEARGDTTWGEDRVRVFCFNPLPLPKQGEICFFPHVEYTRPGFNPLPLPKQGEIRVGDREHDLQPVSIRSPCRSKGRSKGRHRRLVLRACFNPLPLPKQGEMHRPPGHTGQRRRVSIRSPCRSKGRYDLASLDLYLGGGFNPLPLPKQGEIAGEFQPPHPATGFQSAPPAEARGDRHGPRISSSWRRFNPLPLPKQGEMRSHERTDTRIAGVSIRSPCRSKGRWRKLGIHPADPKGGFNPLPLPKQGEIRHRLSFARPSRRFNPLPLPKQGEIAHPSRPRKTLQVSIRSPCRSKGRFNNDVQIEPIVEGVSIRSPCRSKGRSAAVYRHLEALTFQSAPPAEARGDAHPGPLGVTGTGFNPLPLPKQGEIKLLPLPDLDPRGFNPLPLPKQGEILHLCCFASRP